MVENDVYIYNFSDSLFNRFICIICNNSIGWMNVYINMIRYTIILYVMLHY